MLADPSYVKKQCLCCSEHAVGDPVDLFWPLAQLHESWVGPPARTPSLAVYYVLTAQSQLSAKC
jgi:hypothetical protein